MKKIMLFSSMLFSILSFAQTRQEVKEQFLKAQDPQNVKNNLKDNECRFYKSYQDYVSNKYVPDMRMEPGSFTMIMGSRDIKIDKKGKIEKVNLKDLTGYYISDQNGMCLRVYDADLYIVVIEGPYCYYFRDEAANVYKLEDGTFGISRTDPERLPMTYYSETIDGTIEKNADSKLEDLLKQYNLTEQYKKEKPKREMKDSVDEYNSKEKNRDIKYYIMINEMIEKK